MYPLYTTYIFTHMFAMSDSKLNAFSWNYWNKFQKISIFLFEDISSNFHDISLAFHNFETIWISMIFRKMWELC